MIRHTHGTLFDISGIPCVTNPLTRLLFSVCLHVVSWGKETVQNVPVFEESGGGLGGRAGNGPSSWQCAKRETISRDPPRGVLLQGQSSERHSSMKKHVLGSEDRIYFRKFAELLRYSDHVLISVPLFWRYVEISMLFTYLSSWLCFLLFQRQFLTRKHITRLIIFSTLFLQPPHQWTEVLKIGVLRS